MPCVRFITGRDGESHGCQRLSVAPCARLFAEGVVERVLHPARFVDVPHEKDVLAAAVGEVPDLRRRQLQRRESTPIARRRRQFRQRAGGKYIVLKAGYVLDLVHRAVAAGDKIAYLRNVLNVY